MRWYMKSKDPQHIERFLSNLFREKNAFAMPFLSKVFLQFAMDFRPVPVIGKQAAKSIQMPITLIAAGKDLIFPGTKMMKRAKNIPLPEKDRISGRFQTCTGSGREPDGGGIDCSRHMINRSSTSVNQPSPSFYPDLFDNQNDGVVCLSNLLL